MIGRNAEVDAKLRAEIYLHGDYSGKPVGCTLQCGTGGGFRVIRSTKPFS
jgi:hypothetical protein